MASQLRLTRQVAAAMHTQAEHNPVVDLWIDLNLPHLDHPFSYLVPQELSEVIGVGSRVSVPFQGRTLEGLVIRRHAENSPNLKFLSKSLSPFPLLNAGLIESIRTCSQVWAAHPFDFLRSALPDRAITVEKKFANVQQTTPRLKSQAGESVFIQLPPHRDPLELLKLRVEYYQRSGSTLVLVPDIRTLERLNSILSHIPHITLDSSQSKTELYENFLSMVAGEFKLVLGTRNAVFAPLPHLSQIIIFNEVSEHFYDRRNPQWNVRDVALIRSQIEGVNLEFLGYSPSMDLALRIDDKKTAYKQARAKMDVQVYSQTYQELIPSQAVRTIRQALSSGPVLFLAPAKGYAQSIRCTSCKNVSRCTCGSALQMKSKQSGIFCPQCNATYPNWKCSWCDGTVPSLLSRGSDRFAYELGALFPNYSVATFTADSQSISGHNSQIVIATPSMAPHVVNGYAMVVILEGNRFLNQPDTRSGERVRSIYFEAASLVREKGTVIIVQDAGHPIVNALLQWNPAPLIHAEMQELRDLNLPPISTGITLTIETSEVGRVKTAFEKSIGTVLPADISIYGPTHVAEGQSRITFVVPHRNRDQVVEALHEFLRKRSAAKKVIPTVSVAPYSLT